jgi:hypothetical protein
MNSRHLSILGITSVFVVVIFAACVNPRKGYRPIQPIAFSHQLHAGNNQIPCQYCHVSPGEGPNASVPGLNTCMNCHSQVAVDRPEIQKIHTAWKSGEPIKWVKVHDLPDHVKFIHQPHINFGLDCTQCHGDVAKMDVVSTQNRFNMGWCVECHRQPEHPNASTDCVTCHY